MSMNANIIIAILLGLTSGILTGFTGISNIALVLAGLSITKIITDYKVIMGTVLYILMFPFTSGSVWHFYRDDKINFFIGNIIIVTMFLGSIIGTNFVLHSDLQISEKTINYTRSAIAFTLSIYFFYSAYIL
uniref:Membrane transporter protein n=1 Tax=viral metagenome TaxID=1070528 RepID=A0A6C0E1M9_9ZZZZ